MSFEKDYSFLDKLLHYAILSNNTLKNILFDIDTAIFSKDISKINVSNEVFVTGLPRSGTTLVLNLLYSTGEFTTYTYRNMPLIMAPLLWDKITNKFQKESKLKERAHGDGVEVSFDSPEAFEEILWLMAAEDEIVNRDSLNTISKLKSEKKICALLKAGAKKLNVLSQTYTKNQNQQRYLSKNNANISRLKLISRLFPNSIILVPFRNPFDHVGSLLKQHERFTDEHSKSTFSRKYMEWLGHFEFGSNIKPINFNAWLDEKPIDPSDKEFWLEYWYQCYSYILSIENKQIILIDFDYLLANGREVLGKVSEVLKLNNPHDLLKGVDSFRAPGTVNNNIESENSELLEKVNRLYKQLQASAI